MKFLILTITFLSSPAMAIGTYHKTENGKYPHYYAEKSTDTPWDDKDQAAYDQAMDEAIEELCFKSTEVKMLQDKIAEEKAIGKESGYIDATAIHDATANLLRLKKEIEPTAKTIKDETGKDASQYECSGGNDE